MRAVMPLKKNDRNMELSEHKSRVINAGEIHEFLIANDYSQGAQGALNDISYIGFFQFDQGSIIEVGDELIDNDGKNVGIVVGFDYTHLTDGTINHMNIVLRSENRLSGTERGYKAGESFQIFGYDETKSEIGHTPITVAQALFTAFNKLGIKEIFGYPGETGFHYYSALGSFNGNHRMAADETIATHMADSYSRVTNTMGVVDVPKVGAPLTALPLIEAKNSSIPLLLISSGTGTTKEGTHPTCEYNQLTMLGAVTKGQYRLDSPNLLVPTLRKAIQQALSGNPGPVVIEIPSDVLGMQIDNFDVESLSSKINCLIERTTANTDTIIAAINELKTARKPVILAGGGAHQSQAYNQIRNIANAMNIPVATTINGKGAFDETNPLSIGVVGSKGDTFSNALIQDADLLFVIGSKLGDKSTNQLKLLKGKRVIHLDINAEEMKHVIDTCVGMVGDAQATLQKMLTMIDEDLLQSVNYSNRSLDITDARIQRGILYKEYEQSEMPVAPSLLCRALDRKFDSNLIIVADGSMASGWTSVFVKSRGGTRANIQPRGSGMIGYGLPATLGAVIAKNDKQVVGIGGDGGFKPTVHAIETAVQQGLDLTYFVLDDRGLTFMEAILDEAYKYNPLPDVPPTTNLELVAKGFGAKSYTIGTNGELLEFLENHDWKGVNVVILKVNPEMQSPDLLMSIAKNKKVAPKKG